MLTTLLLALALIQSDPAVLADASDAELLSLAENGDSDAQVEWAIRLQNQWLNSSQDPSDAGAAALISEARYWTGQAAEAGNPVALNLLGIQASNGFGRPIDRTEAITHFRRAHEAGDEAATLNLAAHLLNFGEETDAPEAVALLEAYLAGDHDPALEASARGTLGQALSYGFSGIPQDYERAFALLQAAHAAGDTDPQTAFMLARYHESGAGGAEQNPAIALDYFEEAGSRGHGFAAWRAGMMHLDGEGTPASETEALRWVRTSAESGHHQGMISLGVMYALGQGTDIDYAQARHWYGQAATLGSAHAMRALGGMEAFGQGGPDNPVRGIALLELARDAGDALAGQMLNQASPEISADMRTEIEAAKETWLDEHGLTRDDLF